MNTPASTEPIRVLLVDDHTLFRKGLAELLEQRGAITVSGIAGNADDACRILAEARPDVIITDLNMPPNGGLSLLRQLRADGWNGPVLILTVSDAEEDLAAAMQAGAKGYLLKDMEPEDVVDAVQRPATGDVDAAGAGALDLRAHADQELGKVHDLGFAGSVVDDGLFVRE